MYCSTCGSPIPEGQRECQVCGAIDAAPARIPRATLRGALSPRPWEPPRVAVCPRCAYRGEGVTYFSKGTHAAALVGLTVVTVGAMGAGGLIYYLIRRDHLICPRCGRGWGREGERALVPSTTHQRNVAPVVPGAGREAMKRGWSFFLLFFAAMILVAGIVLGEVGMVGAGLLSAGGGALLLKSASHDRIRRREALLAELQHPVLSLAAQQGGRLTVTEVAARLGWPIRRAEKVLQSMDDGVRVDSEVTDEGVIVYEFRELRSSAPPPEPDRRLTDGDADPRAAS